MKSSIVLFCVLACLMFNDCATDNTPNGETPITDGVPSTDPALAEELPAGQALSPINPETDFVITRKMGIINGADEPDSVSIVRNSRYFEIGTLKIQTRGHDNLSGEVIQYRLPGQSGWQEVNPDDHQFFIGSANQRYLVIDNGTSVINRNIRLFDVQTGGFVYSTRYNNALIKDNRLYILRFVDPQTLDSLPECDQSAGAPPVKGYEEVVAIQLGDFSEAKTNQVFCVYQK